jgi:hypothetical protein
MGVYQILTDFLGLSEKDECRLVETDHFNTYLKEAQS